MQVSSNANFAAPVYSSATADISIEDLVMTGLNANATYYLRVGSLNWNGVPNYAAPVMGITSSVAPLSPLVSAMYLSSATVGWTTVASQGFVIQTATSTNFSALTQSSATNSGATSYDILGLSPNTTYFFRIGALNHEGIPTFASEVSSATLALSVSGTSAAVVNGSSMPGTWTALATTPQAVTSEGYVLQASTSANFAAPLVSSVTINAAVNALILTGLSPNTTYYLRVASLNWNYVPNYASAVLGITKTMGPATLTINDVVLSSAALTWSAATAQGYTVQTATSSDFVTLVQSSNTDNVTTSLNILGLTANTTYFFRVGSFNHLGQTVYGAVATTTTWAPAPTSLGAVSVYVSSLTATWTAVANSQGYRLEASTAAAFSSVAASSVTADNSLNLLLLTGLTQNTTYFLRVGAYNKSNVLSYSASTQAYTLATQVGAITVASMYETSATITWTALGSGQGSVLQASTSSTFTGTVASSQTSNSALGSLTVNSLSANTTYYFRVGTLNTQGLPNYSTDTSSSTLATQVSAATFYQVFGTSLTVNWAAVASNPQSATAEGYRLEASASADFSGTILSSVTTNIEVSTLSIAGLTGNTSYYLRIGSLNWNNVPNYVLVGSTLTEATSQVVTVAPSESETVTYTPPSGPVVVEIPAGTFERSVVVTVETPPSYPTAGSSAGNLTGTNVGPQITNDQSLQPQKEIELTISYRDSDVTGLDESTLVVARYDSDSNVWVPFVTTTDPANNRVRARVNHLSIFQVMANVPGTNVDNPVVYPNPMRPSRNQNWVTFANVPANTRIRIYTISGELVREETADATGMAQWNAVNTSGENVASGVYIALIEGAGDRKTLKVAIQR